MKSIKVNPLYIVIHANKGIDKTLYSNAALKSRVNIDINPLVMPQPKQETPQKALIGHKWIEKILVIINRKTKKTTPTHKECKVCLFLLSMLIVLYQWLTITVSETT